MSKSETEQQKQDEEERHIFDEALKELQGNVLAGYKGLDAACFRGLTFRPGMARDWLERALETGHLTKQRGCDDQGGNIAPTFNIAFTCAGLRQLGVDESYIQAFSEPFKAGMWARSQELNEGDRSLGDTGASAPSTWEEPFNGNALHAIVSVHARGTGASPCDHLADLLTSKDHIETQFVQEAKWPPGRREHFGFKDGIGRPRIRGAQGRLASRKRFLPKTGRYSDRPIALGEFLLGYDADGTDRRMRGAPIGDPAHELMKNGTYMVYRKLQQDVAEFRRFTLARSGGNANKAKLLAAQIIGRWPDGTPLQLDPHGTNKIKERDLDAFDYDTPIRNDFAIDENDGLCPLGAHIRRMNPRKQHLATHKRRILRRGVPYGPPLPDGETDTEERGLIFIALNSDIEMQFEFLQSRWANSGNFRRLNSYERDPLIGANDGGEKSQFRVRGEDICENLPRFVTVRGGAYLFVPSLSALEGLRDGAFSNAPGQNTDALKQAIDRTPQ